jgi:hypothetical protein
MILKFLCWEFVMEEDNHDLLRKIKNEIKECEKLKFDGQKMCVVQIEWYKNLEKECNRYSKSPKSKEIDNSDIYDNKGNIDTKKCKFVKEEFFDLLVKAFGGGKKIIVEVYRYNNALFCDVKMKELKIFMNNNNDLVKSVPLHINSSAERFFYSVMWQFKLSAGDKVRLWKHENGTKEICVYKTYDEFKNYE